ncbi:MAG: OsmC family protein [Desulfobacterales bacterium]
MEPATKKMETQNTVNGVNVDELFGTIDAVKKAPVIATFKFRANNEWIDGGHNRTTIRNFYGTQQEHERKKPFVLDADEPPILLGNDHGPNPVEYALTALAACVTTSIVYHAAAKGVTIRSMESRLEGDIDLQGFLGLRDDVPRGYKEIRMFVNIDADAPAEKLEEIVKLGPTYSPVFDTITRAVPVKVQLAK